MTRRDIRVLSTSSTVLSMQVDCLLALGTELQLLTSAKHHVDVRKPVRHRASVAGEA